MRFAVLLVAVGLLGFGAAHATIPDEANCSVTPCDGYGAVIISPDYNLASGVVDPLASCEFTVNVRNANNDPIPTAYVEIVFGVPANHLLCNDAVLTATTDVNGDAVFNISGGGCTLGTDAIRIIANSVEIRSYDAVKSPDFTGSADGSVSLGDFTYFSSTFGSLSSPCTDYLGAGQVILGDFTFFAGCFGYYCEETTP